MHNYAYPRYGTRRNHTRAGHCSSSRGVRSRTDARRGSSHRWPAGLGAAEGGTGYDDFVLRLIHAFYTPPNAPKQHSCPHTSVRFGQVDSGRLQQLSAPCTMHQRPRKATHRDRGANTIEHSMHPARRPQSHTPRPSAPLVRAGRSAAPELFSGASTTTTEG